MTTVRWHASLIGIGAAITLAAAGDLAARAVLGHDLISLARAAAPAPPSATTAPSAPIPQASDGVLVTTVQSARYSILAVVSPACAQGPECPIRITIEPAPGRQLSVDAPYAYLGERDAAFAYDGPPGKIRAVERTTARAVVDVPGRLVLGTTPTRDAIDGRVRVVTCDADTCASEISKISIALPPRRPTS